MLPSLEPLSRAFRGDEHVTPAAYPVRWLRGRRPGLAFGLSDLTGNPAARQSRVDPDSVRRRRQAPPPMTASDLGPEATGDIATGRLIETWIDEAERRAWFLYEACRSGQAIAFDRHRCQCNGK